MQLKFFSLIKHFNDGIDFDIYKKREWESYFEYRWLNNKNSAIDDDDERAQLEQLPESTQNMLYRDFLYQEFMKDFQVVFRFPKEKLKTKVFKKPQIFYTWND